MVRTNILNETNHGKPVLMVTSPKENELQPLISSKLAISFAEIGKKVLLVDANFRKPALHELFGINNRIGLSNLLMDEEGEASEVFIQNLYMLPTGSYSMHLEGFEKIEQLMTEWKRYYDAVIVEAPAFLEVADSQILLAACSGMILVIQENQTKKEDVLRTKKMLERGGYPILGAIYQTS
ncbi:hypothetical protein AWH49_03235 [Domibacillus aminovorans]|uniref:Non-specific protein-tyrosine kinase n=2 Tax=Domibacillus aminovorans TaxID=29332 RepID=A0A177L2F4_9BACI|nr:hypothetical protein AWH49_03235 [Domibacillus aminovorans]